MGEAPYEDWDFRVGDRVQFYRQHNGLLMATVRKIGAEKITIELDADAIELETIRYQARWEDWNRKHPENRWNAPPKKPRPQISVGRNNKGTMRLFPFAGDQDLQETTCALAKATLEIGRLKRQLQRVRDAAGQP